MSKTHCSESCDAECEKCNTFGMITESVTFNDAAQYLKCGKERGRSGEYREKLRRYDRG